MELFTLPARERVLLLLGERYVPNWVSDPAEVVKGPSDVIRALSAGPGKTTVVVVSFRMRLSQSAKCVVVGNQ